MLCLSCSSIGTWLALHAPLRRELAFRLLQCEREEVFINLEGRFSDRKQAGAKLALRLTTYSRRPDVVVLGLPEVECRWLPKLRGG